MSEIEPNPVASLGQHQLGGKTRVALDPASCKENHFPPRSKSEIPQLTIPSWSGFAFTLSRWKPGDRIVLADNLLPDPDAAGRLRCTGGRARQHTLLNGPKSISRSKTASNLARPPKAIARLGRGQLRALRRCSADQRAQIVEESFRPGGGVAAVARRHDVHPSLLHVWRREARQTSDGRVSFVPVTVSAENKPLHGGGLIEIDLGKGVRLRVDGGIDEEALGRVLRALSR